MEQLLKQINDDQEQHHSFFTGAASYSSTSVMSEWTPLEQRILDTELPDSVSAPILFDPLFMSKEIRTHLPLDKRHFRKAGMPYAAQSLQKIKGWENIATAPNYIFEQTSTTNEIVKGFLKNAFRSKEFANLIYQDMRFKLGKEKMDRLKLAKKNKEKIDNIRAVLSTHKPELSINDMTLDAFLDSLNILEQEQMFCEIHNLKDDIAYLRHHAESAYKAMLMSTSRCFVFLPCLIKYSSGKEAIITLVSMSGDTQMETNAKRVALDDAMKAFSNDITFKHEGRDVKFCYVDSVSSKFNEIYLRLNEDINPFDEKYLAPEKPSRHCGEKKVYSELIKHFIERKEQDIESIEILGETNIHVPKLSEWATPLETRPLNSDICEEQDALQQSMQDDSLYIMFMQNIDAILNTIDNFMSLLSPERKEELHKSFFSKAKTEAEKLKRITGREDTHEIKAMLRRFSIFELANNYCKKKWKMSDKELPKFNAMEIKSIPGLMSSTRAFIANEIVRNFYKDNKAKGFYVESTFDINNPEYNGTHYFPIHYRDACESCQELKPAYLSLMMNANDKGATVATHSSTSSTESSSSSMVFSSPSLVHGFDLMRSLSPKRCSMHYRDSESTTPLMPPSSPSSAAASCAFAFSN